MPQTSSSKQQKQAEEASRRSKQHAQDSLPFRSLPVAAQLAQRVAAHVKSVQARAAGNQPLDRGQFLDEVAGQVQTLQLL